METGSEKYYWVNNIVGMEPWDPGLWLSACADFGVAIGVLTNVGKTANSSLLKIDAWNVSIILVIKRRYANEPVCIGLEYHQVR